MKNLYEEVRSQRRIKYDPKNDYHQFLLSEYLLELGAKEAIKRVEKQLNDERIRKLNDSILSKLV
tara:strand:- start:232 stop:426 length:195 start_codon:yes stop_codon:yes gene_type:complete